MKSLYAPLSAPATAKQHVCAWHKAEFVIGAFFLLTATVSLAQSDVVPKDPAVLQQQLKDIAEADNPDDASMVFEDMRDALKSSHEFNVNVLPSIRLHLSQLDVNDKDFQSGLASARAGVQQPCTKESAQLALAPLNRLLSFGGAISPFSYTKTFADIQNLQTLAPEKLCAALKPGQGQLPIEKDFADDLQQDRRDSQQRLISASQLAGAYKQRYDALKTLRAKLTKENSLRGDMLWIVGGVCLFACITLSVIRLYTQEQAMEFIKSGQLIQFPTVMILLVVIVVLGLTSILQENTLGTLLGGVAGYVLSQGVGRAAFRDAERSATVRATSPLQNTQQHEDPSGSV